MTNELFKKVLNVTIDIMCLYTKQTEPEIAKEDIVCYKYYGVLKECGRTKLMSSYRGAPAPDLNEVAHTDLDETSKVFYWEDKKYNIVDKGFHSFKNLDDIKEELIFRDMDFVAFKCIIPKGSKFYLGIFKYFLSYCSDQIKLINTVEL